MDALAARKRFEEAADVRDRARALTAALRRQRLTEGLRRAGRVVIDFDDMGGAEVVSGRLVRSWGADRQPALLSIDGVTTPELPQASEADPLSKEDADEVVCIAGWLRDKAHRVRVLHADCGLTSPIPPVPSFEPLGPRSAATPGR